MNEETLNCIASRGNARTANKTTNESQITLTVEDFTAENGHHVRAVRFSNGDQMTRCMDCNFGRGHYEGSQHLYSGRHNDKVNEKIEAEVTTGDFIPEFIEEAPELDDCTVEEFEGDEISTDSDEENAAGEEGDDEDQDAEAA